MADLQVSADVDTLMKSAATDAMRASLGITFDNDKRQDVILTDTYQDIGNLTTPSRLAGTYMVSFSVAYSYDSITKSIYFRFRVDGSAWFEFAQEGKDITDERSFTYFYPQDFTAGVHVIELQGRKEDATDNATVQFADTSFQRI